MCYKCHEINLNCGGSYTDSINKKGNKYFLYAVTVTLNHEETGKNPERITKIKPFLNKYKIMNLKKLEKNNVTIALKV